MRRRAARAAALLATASAGLLAAHELDYRLVLPDPLHRHDLLLRTGHGYLARAAVIAGAIALLASLAAIATGYRRGGTRAPFGVTFARLALVQSGGFVALESVERLVVGAPPDDRLPVVTAVGVAVQIGFAWLGARLLALLARAGARAAAAARRRIGARHLGAIRPSRQRGVRSRSVLRRAIRGPPVPA